MDKRINACGVKNICGCAVFSCPFFEVELCGALKCEMWNVKCGMWLTSSITLLYYYTSFSRTLQPLDGRHTSHYGKSHVSTRTVGTEYGEMAEHSHNLSRLSFPSVPYCRSERRNSLFIGWSTLFLFHFSFFRLGFREARYSRLARLLEPRTAFSSSRLLPYS